MDDTRIDLSQLDESRTVPSTPKQNSPQAVGESSEITPATTTLVVPSESLAEEPVAGTSDGIITEVAITDTSQDGLFESLFFFFWNLYLIFFLF